MSLKAIHIVFIIASSLMTAFFGYWSWTEFLSPEGSRVHLILGIASIVALAALLDYGKYFLNKLKHISYL